MALFPAYSSKDLGNNIIEDPVEVNISEKSTLEYTENQLLASDSEESQDEPPAKVSRLLVNVPQLQSDDDFYIDCKIDRGNLRVSTLYYPGRPQYECAIPRGGGTRDVGGVRSRRYFTRRLPDPDVPDVDERAAAYRALLVDRPHDVALWETYITFQEECAGEAAALCAVEEAMARAPFSARLRARHLACLRASLASHELLERLRDMLSTEKTEAARVELWELLLSTLSAARGSDAAQVSAAAAAALAASPRRAAPRLLHALGSYLRAAGLWERLVLLVELLVAMNYAPVSLPPPDTHVADRSERRLLEVEDKAMASGLPLSAVWVRVERARAAAHWRPAPLASAPAIALADPQRTPVPHDVADLLLPVTADDQLLHLSVRMLLLAKVPMLPATDHWVRWAGGAGAGAGGEAVLPLLLAARSLPPAHPARPSPGLARRLLLLLVDPPHYFSDDTGYLSWVNALWEACCTRAQGWARIALVCWRLRWLHALLLASGGEEGEGGGEETRRLRGEGRALLKRFAAGSPLPYAEWARLEHSAGGGGAGRALHAALQALRVALADAACPPHHALHAARTVCEVSSSGGTRLGAEGITALVCAALGRAMPPATTDTTTTATTTTNTADAVAADRRAALEQCERRCEAIERELEAGGRAEGEDEDRVDCADALLPGEGEWARARVALASPARRAFLLERLCGAAPAAASAAAARYWEETAEALATTTRAAPRLAALFPHNATLALAAAGAPLWAGARGGPALAALPARPAPLPALFPALLAALRSDWAPAEAEALVRVARRVTSRACGGDDEAALAWSVRIEAEARAPRPRLPHALYAALECSPHHKWLYVRGAAWCGGEAAVLADALLERSLRLHALPAELDLPSPVAPPAPARTPAALEPQPNAEET